MSSAKVIKMIRGWMGGRPQERPWAALSYHSGSGHLSWVRTKGKKYFTVTSRNISFLLFRMGPIVFL